MSRLPYGTKVPAPAHKVRFVVLCILQSFGQNPYNNYPILLIFLLKSYRHNTSHGHKEMSMSSNYRMNKDKESNVRKVRILTGVQEKKDLLFANSI